MPSVGIFWDYENCQFMSGCSGFDVAKNIERVALAHGPIASFNAYLDLQQCAVPASIRSELQSTGVALVDCPHNGQKDVVDQMLQTDMLVFALDHPAPATIVLISGDRDFAYVASILRRRMYNVVLICHSTPGPHKSLLQQVSTHVDWNTQVLGLPSSSLDYLRRPSAQAPAPLRPPLPPTPFNRASTSPSTQISGAAKPQKSTKEELPASATKPPLSSDDVVTPVHTQRMSSPGLPGSGAPSMPKDSRASQDSGIAVDAAKLSSPPLAKPTVTTPHSYSDVSVKFAPLIAALRSLHERGEHRPVRSTVGIALRAKETKAFELAGVSSFKEYAAAAVAEGVVAIGGSQTSAWISLADESSAIISVASSDSGATSVSSGDQSSEPPSAAGDDPSPADGRASAAQMSSDSALPSTSSVSTLSDSSTGQLIPPIAPSDPPTRANVFACLVDVLRSLHLHGQKRPRRALVNVNLMAIDRHFYTKAGYERFGDYVGAAAAAGIVFVGGAETGENAWVALSSDYLDESAAGVQPSPMQAGASAGQDTPLAKDTATLAATLLQPSPQSLGASSRTPLDLSSSTISMPNNSPNPSTSSVAAKQFDILINVMLLLLEAGNVRPRPHEVSLRLLRANSQLYKESGVKDIQGYCALAAAAGVLDLGGEDTNAWVSLTPQYVAQLRALPDVVDPGVPPYFRPLVQLLRAQIRAGYLRSNCSVIGGILRNRDPAVFKKAGVSDYAAYLLQASEAGLVTLGGGSKEGESTGQPSVTLADAWREQTFCKQLGTFWDAFYTRYEVCTVRAQHQADAEGPESGGGNWIASAEWVSMRAGFLDVEYSTPLAVTELQSRVCWNYLEVNVRRVLAKLPLAGSGPYKLLFLAALSNDCALTPYMHVLSWTRPNCELPCGLTGLLPLAVQRFAAMKSCLQSSPSQMRMPMYELIRDPITIGGTLAQFLLPTPNPMTSTMLFTTLDASAREKMIAEHVVCIVDHVRKTLRLGLAECVQALNAYIYAAPLAASVFDHL
ncbi:NYN domain-containing protein [Schizophyllum commune]